MLTVRDVAERLNVSQPLVYQLVVSGRLACHRVGLGRGTIRVTEADLAAYLDDCHQRSRDEHAPESPQVDAAGSDANAKPVGELRRNALQRSASRRRK